MTKGGMGGWGVLLLIVHLTLTVNSQWPEWNGVGWGSSFWLLMSLQLSTPEWPRVGWGGWWDPVPDCSSHLTLISWWPRVGGGGGVSCSSLFISLATVNSWWLRVGGVGMGCPPPHCSSHFNSQLLMTKGGMGVGWGVLLLIASSHLTVNSWWPRVGGVGLGCPAPHCFISLPLSTPDDQGWDGVGWGCPAPDCFMSLPLSTPDDQGWVGWGWGVLLLIAHVTSTLNSWWPRDGWDDDQGWVGALLIHKYYVLFLSW